MNTLIVIGFLGSNTCYLNVEREEAIRRYLEESYDGEYKTLEEAGVSITEFTFVDQFSAYEASK